MNAQLSRVEQDILRAQRELAAKQQLASVLSGTPLANKSCVLFDHDNLYGAIGGYGFKSLDCTLSELLAVFELIPHVTFQSGFTYTMPADYVSVWDSKKPNNNIKKHFKQWCGVYACVSVKGYNLSFWGRLNGKLYKVSLDFMQEIIGQDCSTLATGNKIPHLVENKLYTANGRHGPKYYGKHGAADGSFTYSCYHTHFSELKEITVKI